MPKSETLMTKRARDLGLACGALPPGPLNAITDVAGVSVGHETLREGDLLTGFTALLPHQGNLFRSKLRAAVEIINGFGKSAGLMQLAELGEIETPILLGNTLAVGVGFDALVTRALAQNADIGRETGTVNPLVLECNDGFLSDIRARALTQDRRFRGARCGARRAGGGGRRRGRGGHERLRLQGRHRHGLARDAAGWRAFTLGVLVLANFGRAGDLVLPDGRRPAPAQRRARPSAAR